MSTTAYTYVGLPAGTATVADDATPNDGVSGATGAGIPVIRFANPTDELDAELAAGGTLNLNDLDGLFAATLGTALFGTTAGTCST